MCKSSSLFDLCLPFDLVGTGGVGAVSQRFIWSEVQREEISMYLYLTRTFFYRYWQQRKQPQTLLWLPGLKFLVVHLWVKLGFPEPILRLWEMQHWYISGEEGGPQWTIKTHTAPRWPDSPCQNVTIVSQNTLAKYPTFWTKEYMKTWNLNKKVVTLATFLFLSCPLYKHTLKMESENKRLNLCILVKTFIFASLEIPESLTSWSQKEKVIFISREKTTRDFFTFIIYSLFDLEDNDWNGKHSAISKC